MGIRGEKGSNIRLVSFLECPVDVLDGLEDPDVLSVVCVGDVDRGRVLEFAEMGSESLRDGQ